MNGHDLQIAEKSPKITLYVWNAPLLSAQLAE